MFIDPLEKKLIYLMFFILGIMAVFSFIGTTIMHGEMGGTDAYVEEMAAESAGKTGAGVVDLEELLGHYGEPIGFTMAGVIAGLIAGFIWPRIFEIRSDDNHA